MPGPTSFGSDHAADGRGRDAAIAVMGRHDSRRDDGPRGDHGEREQNDHLATSSPRWSLERRPFLAFAATPAPTAVSAGGSTSTTAGAAGVAGSGTRRSGSVTFAIGPI